MSSSPLAGWRPALLAGLVLSACGGTPPAPAPTPQELTRVERLAPGSECATGGIQLQSGVDDDADGRLEEGEVDGRENVCNSADTLVVATHLLPGDAQCVNGGTRIDSGADDGEGGGTASDGILQPGEVDSTQHVCSEQVAFPIEPYTPPAGPAGAFTIEARGGRGTSGSGGAGGNFTARLDSGSHGGHVKVFRTGLTDASWQPPASVVTFFGPRPLVVEGSVTVRQVANGDRNNLAAGDYFVEVDSALLRRWTGQGEEEVTGIDVRAGATLTLQALATSNQVRVFVANDIRLAGTLTSTLQSDGMSRSSASLFCDTWYSLPGAKVDLRGLDGAEGADGGNGGRFEVEAVDQEHGLSQPFGLLVNQATIDTSGGNGANGGSAGPIELWAESVATNTGALTARGGVGSTGSGGSGGSIELECDYGHNSNSGTFDASGGKGAHWGGSAGGLDLYIGYPGDLRNTGTLIARGGDVDASCTEECGGGSGGYVEFYVYGGLILNAADIDTRGGFGAAGSGGAGGWLYVGSSWDTGWADGWYPVDDVLFSGNIATSGGDGASGGGAGHVEFEVDCQDMPLNQEIVLSGYTTVNLSGGEGHAAGGAAGDFSLENARASSRFTSEGGPGGGVFNHASVLAEGGSSETGAGGEGGDVTLFTDDTWGFATHGMLAQSHGDLELSGGSGVTAGGNAGGLYLYGHDGAALHGNVIATGGAASGEGGVGGSSSRDALQVFADLGTVEVSGSISLEGGAARAARGQGGHAPAIEIVGDAVINSAAMRSVGGSANTTDGVGGNGNVIFLYGIETGTQNTATSFSVAAGAGFTEGQAGEVFIDAQNMTGQLDAR